MYLNIECFWHKAFFKIESRSLLSVGFGTELMFCAFACVF